MLTRAGRPQSYSAPGSLIDGGRDETGTLLVRRAAAATGLTPGNGIRSHCRPTGCREALLAPVVAGQVNELGTLSVRGFLGVAGR
jgi:hypothetical protein